MQAYKKFIYNLRGMGIRLNSYGQVGGKEKYDMYEAIIGNPKNPAVLITSGVHGDEFSGPIAITKFLLKANKYLDRACFYVYPCINPIGYGLCQRGNGKKQDINRGFFDGTKVKECQLFMSHLKKRKRRYVFSIDLHEMGPDDEEIMAAQGIYEEFDDFPEECYLYEICPNKKIRIGHKIVEAIEVFAPICKWPKIFSDINSGGVVYYPEGSHNKDYLEGKTMDQFLQKNYTNQAFTTETYTQDDINLRVNIQLAIIETAIKERCPVLK